MRIDFYYWGTQCPIIEETILLLKKFKGKVDWYLHDITDDQLIANQQKMFFPFLTVVDEKHRYRGPISEKLLNNFLEGKLGEEKPYIIPLAKEIYEGNIIPLTMENIAMISHGCTMSQCKGACRKKGKFLSSYCDGVFGFINVKDNKVLGGVEYLPSLVVPYNIPRDKDVAFLTCVYHSSSEYDFKSTPLKVLENYLKTRYNKILVITDEQGTFPNGNLNWFIDQGYQDEYILSEEQNYCKLHLMSKIL
jgi:hypothetical protein